MSDTTEINPAARRAAVGRIRFGSLADGKPMRLRSTFSMSKGSRPRRVSDE